MKDFDKYDKLFYQKSGIRLDPKEDPNYLYFLRLACLGMMQGKYTIHSTHDIHISTKRVECFCEFVLN